MLAMKPGRLRAVNWTEAIVARAMHALNPVRRVGDQIAEPSSSTTRSATSEAAAKVEELLEQVGLPARHGRPTTRTSCRAASASR